MLRKIRGMIVGMLFVKNILHYNKLLRAINNHHYVYTVVYVTSYIAGVCFRVVSGVNIG